MPETNATQLTWYGQSAFKIVTPTGKVLLIDPWITNPLNKNAKTDLANLTKVDLMFITHGHGDHVGDAFLTPGGVPCNALDLVEGALAESLWNFL